MPMHKLTGTVTDENGAPVTGATVIVVGTQRGTTTSATGAYTLQVRNGEILEFQYLGYEKQAVSVGGQTTLDVTLQPSKAMAVDEVVVIGYGTVKKGNATGSVANIKISDVKDLPVLSVDQALQGRVAGADIMSTTGEPGATTSIRIRGTRSISASNEPLIVVDGVMDAVSDLNDLNMADIESVTILKDASSTAIYGSRGSNGVIIVTTKGGGNQTNTKPSITLKADIGFSQLPRKLDVMNATEFALYRNDFAYFSTQSGYEDIGEGTPQSKYPFKDPFSLGKGTDWIDEITRTAPYQNYSLSISGRSKRGLLRLAGLQRFAGYHRQQRSAAHHGASESRPPAVQMAEGRLPAATHGATTPRTSPKSAARPTTARPCIFRPTSTRRRTTTRFGATASGSIRRVRRSTRTPTPSSGPRSTTRPISKWRWPRA